MPNRSAEVDAYIADAPQDRREVLEALRAACLDELDGFEERIEYKMPAYVRDGEAEIAFASRSQYMTFHVMRPAVMEAHRAALEHLDLGKGCIRYRKPEDVDLDLVRSLLRSTANAGT